MAVVQEESFEIVLAVWKGMLGSVTDNGAALFGIGWGLSGYCPGPGVVSLFSGDVSSYIFVLCMLVGMWSFHLVNKKLP